MPSRCLLRRGMYSPDEYSCLGLWQCRCMHERVCDGVLMYTLCLYVYRCVAGNCFALQNDHDAAIRLFERVRACHMVVTACARSTLSVCCEVFFLLIIRSYFCSSNLFIALHVITRRPCQSILSLRTRTLCWDMSMWYRRILKRRSHRSG